MTDTSARTDRDLSHSAPSVHTDTAARKRLARRYAAERRFKFMGLGAVGLAGLFLILLMSTIVGQGLPAFTNNYVLLDLDLNADRVDSEDPRSADYSAIIREGIDAEFPFVTSRTERRALRGLISGSADILLREDVLANSDLLGGERALGIPVSDTADLYLKGLIVTPKTIETRSNATASATEGEVELLFDTNALAPVVTELKEGLEQSASRLGDAITRTQRSITLQQSLLESLEQEAESAAEGALPALAVRIDETESTLAALTSQAERERSETDATRLRIEAIGAMNPLSDNERSYLVHINGGVVKITGVSNEAARGEVFIPLNTTETTSDWMLVQLDLPESSRKISDREIVYLDKLVGAGVVESRFNKIFFTRGTSREPEFAGIWGAVVGSFFTMIVTLLLAFPLGVAAAIYLEEFAPVNRWTHLIEVNINNLAAVPSIVFGLLGLAVFLNTFGLPRSAPLVGGMVLALMTLPTIIIASRAAIKAVPPSIREAALGVGASNLQTAFHHVLPLAMPGILTGTIIGMAQALGETAPLLMIGMVAFIVDIPGGFLDPATVLPVQIYMWADFPEQGFQQKTAAAIVVLLLFLVIMNAIAVLLRKTFERRW